MADQTAATPAPQPPVAPTDSAQLGLTGEQVRAAQVRFGRNELREAAPTPRWKVFARQFSGALILMLLAACVLAAALGELAEALAIAAILVLNGIIGYRQEGSAERAVRALRAMTAPRAQVLRDGHGSQVPAAEVVPGDCLLLEAGDVVAADAQLLQAHDLQTVESMLTGESEPVAKSLAACPTDAPLAERTDCVFAGTRVAVGTGRARVTATGMNTEIGKIAGMLGQNAATETPLQHRLEQVGRTLLKLCLGVTLVVAAQSLYLGRPWLEVLLTAISLAVAAVPEGLPVMVTVALALGVQRMAKRNVLVRKLPAVETLGCTTIICTDKTGTLTTGEMSVRDVWASDENELLRCAALCCDAELGQAGQPGHGDPTELAILQAARNRAIERSELESMSPRLGVHPFDADRKRMSVWREVGAGQQQLFVKGALEGLLKVATHVPAGLAIAAEELAERGLRVLAVATGTQDAECDLRLVGLLGLADPPRQAAVRAVQQAREAGIRVVMITGDHPRTAAAIGREMGIVQELEDPAELIHARATPSDKLRIVATWQSRGAVVAMTGDGVNDAPALERADIGIAMGKAGTEVTRQAADMVLADDNFASIIAAVQEGRAIFSGIRRSLVYLVTGAVAKLGVVLAASVAGWPVPLVPLQILWINLVTDGAPSLALVMEPADGEVLKQPPRPAKEPMLGWPQWTQVAWVGVLETLVVLAVYGMALNHYSLDQARTLAFTAMATTQLWRTFGARHDTRGLWQLKFADNPRLAWIVAASIAATVALSRFGPTQSLFGLGSVPIGAMAACLGVSLVPLMAVELGKVLRSTLKHPVRT